MSELKKPGVTGELGNTPIPVEPTAGSRPSSSPPPLPGAAAPARRRAERSTGAPMATPTSVLVGRDTELATMLEAAEAALDFQAPLLISIVGNQGTGKSRLVEEFVRELGDRARIYRGRAQADRVPHWALSELLRDRCGLEPQNTGEAALSAFRAVVEEVFSDRRVAEVLHFLGTFLNLEYPVSPFLRILDENDVHHDEIRQTVLRRFIEHDGASSPLVLVFEDLQWADEEMIAALRLLGRDIGGAPVVIIAAVRSDLAVRFANWGEGQNEHLRVELRNLESEHAETMFRNLLNPVAELPSEVVEDAVEMTGGSPAFIHHLVDEYIKSGALRGEGSSWTIDIDRALETELEIGIDEAIQARIAALEVFERNVLEKGTTFGNVFWAGAVVALCRLEQSRASDNVSTESDALEWTEDAEPIRQRVVAALRDLVDRDYLLELDAEDSTIAGDIEYVFKHNLERELISKSTEPKARSSYYRAGAQWLETNMASPSEEQLEFLAQLCDRGGDRRRAGVFYLEAGDKARETYSNEQAVKLYELALERIDEDDAAARLHCLHNLGDVLECTGYLSQALKRFDAMLRCAWLYESRSKGGAARVRVGRVRRSHGDYDQAMAHFRAALTLYKEAGDNRGIASSLDDMGQVHWRRGAYVQALDLHRQSLSIRRGLGDQRSLALSLANIARVHYATGQFGAAVTQCREALEIRRRIHDKPGIVRSLLDLGEQLLDTSQAAEAHRVVDEAHAIANQMGNRLDIALTLSRVGDVETRTGDGMRAVEHLLEAVSMATELDNQIIAADAYLHLAEAWLVMGDCGQAADYANRALSVSQACRSRLGVAHGTRVLAEVTAATAANTEQIESAEALFRKAVEILSGMGHQPGLARVYRVFASLLSRKGLVDEAARVRKAADDIYSRMEVA